MPMSFTPKSLTASHPSRPLPWLPWLASVLFLIGIVAVGMTLVLAMSNSDEDTELRVSVVDAESNEALANAIVVLDGNEYDTGDDGVVSVPIPSDQSTISIERDGYHARSGDVAQSDQPVSWVVPLRPRDADQLALSSNAPVSLNETGGEDSTPLPPTVDTDLATDQATAVIDSDIVATPEVATPDATPAATPQVAAAAELAGTITNANGEPVQGALITDGSTTEVTGADGVFSLQASAFSSDNLRVTAAGYADSAISFGESGDEPLAVQLEQQPIKAIYMNPNISDTEQDVDRLIDLINTTELNAIVIDVKEELIFYDSDVEFFEEVDTITPIIDVPALIERLDEHNIYSIARHVVFKDSLVAERRPDLAVKNNVTGEVWRDMNGVAWVNPNLHVLWDANTELAVELGELGFDEVQYDYVRFPTDGDLSTMDFGLPYNEENRVRAITKFLAQSQQALLPLGTKLSADVFGFTALVPDDLGIGQDLTELAPYVDYLSPMVYPSHFPDGAMGLDGHPNNYPYETIEISMRTGAEQLGSPMQLRPWLQDFDFWDMIPYGVEEVRAQIDAAEDVGTSGWMLWDPNNVYTDGALGPDEGNMSRFETPSAILPGSSSTRTLGRRFDSC